MDVETIGVIVGAVKIVAGVTITIATFFIGVYRDSIMSALNIKDKKNHIKISTADLLDKNLEAYQKMFDGYVDRKEGEDKRQESRVALLEQKVETIEIENKKLKFEWNEKDMEVVQMRRELHEIKNMLAKALKQLEYYKKNSDIELPKDLE